MNETDLSLPRWYHGPLGNEKRAEARETPRVELDKEQTAAWRAWMREETERQEEARHVKPIPPR